MDLSASTLWWLATGALVVLELTSGTFYLLMLALGAAAGALAAHLGCPPPPRWRWPRWWAAAPRPCCTGGVGATRKGRPPRRTATCTWTSAPPCR
jgi:hypothetical protein